MLCIMFNISTVELQGNEAPDHTETEKPIMAKQDRKRTAENRQQTIARRQARAVRYSAAVRTTQAGRAR